MKKNRIMAYALAGALLIGGTFTGTKAWFSDSASAKSDLVITMGNLDLNVQYEGSWIKNEDSEATLEVDDFDNFKVLLSNAKPGDKITREINVINDGTLAMDLVAEATQIDGLNVTLDYVGASDFIDYNEKEQGKVWEVGNLKKGEYVAFKITIEVPEKGAEQNEDQNKEIKFNGDLVNINATQR